MDEFGSDLGRPSAVCTGIEIKKREEGGSDYLLTGCDNDNGRYFQFSTDEDANNG